MELKSMKILVMIVFFNIALISCSQNVSLDSIKGNSSSNDSTIETAQTLTYSKMDLLEGIRYEIPSDWKTCIEDNIIYHYCNDENYLMVSSISTEFTEDVDNVLTDKCADTLLDTLNQYPDFLLETDCTGEVDGAYCRKLVCSYTSDTNETIIERSVVFSVGGVVYSFDCVSLNNQQKNNEDFRRIIGSVIISPNY